MKYLIKKGVALLTLSFLFAGYVGAMDPLNPNVLTSETTSAIAAIAMSSPAFVYMLLRRKR